MPASVQHAHLALSKPSTINRVREALEALAFDLDVLVEFEHDEG